MYKRTILCVECALDDGFGDRRYLKLLYEGYLSMKSNFSPEGWGGCSELDIGGFVIFLLKIYKIYNENI